MSDISEGIDYQALFESAPQLNMVLTPDYFILAATDAYLKATMTRREDIVGRYLFEVFPDNPDDLTATGTTNLRESLETVVRTRAPHMMAVQKYDIRSTSKAGGAFEERYWTPVNSPVFDAQGNLKCIIHRVEDVTEVVKNRQENGNFDFILRSEEIQKQTRELTRLNEELSLSKDQALEASKFKSEFLANMSHEIRTPMNGILGMTEIILRTKLEDKLRDQVQVIREAGQSLLSVINDILDFSKIEAGKLNLEMADYDPIRLVESVGDLLAEQARNKDISLITYIDPAIPTRLRGDPVRLRQILMNLAGNAIKFSDQGEVIVKVTLADKSINGNGDGNGDSNASSNGSFDPQHPQLLFSVIDQGIGLTDDEKAKLFRPFVQGDGTMTRKYGGTGLGLSISKRLVEIMEGEIGITSAKGVGSTFWFQVPQANAKEGEENKIIGTILTGAKILIVDDEPHARDTLQNYVSAWGMEADRAASAEEALVKLKAAAMEGMPYQLVMIDLIMPGMSGVDLAKTIFSDIKLRNARLILVTGFDRPGMSEEAMDLGFAAYLTKPVRQGQLFDCLASVISGGRKVDKDAKPSRPSQAHNGQTTSLNHRRQELILVVDDHPVNQQVALLLLQDLGFEAHVAENGKLALTALNRTPYALVFMDIQMPEMNGFEATQEIRKKELATMQHLPVIAMTAHAVEGSRESCVAAGMDDYVSKPIDPESLKKILDKWLPDQTEVLMPSTREGSYAKQAAQTGVAIDIDGLARRFGREQIPGFANIFTTSTPEEIASLKRALSSTNRHETLRIAHSLKGSCGSMLAYKMKECCQEIEQRIFENNWSQVEELVELLEAEYVEVAAALRSAVSEHASS